MADTVRSVAVWAKAAPQNHSTIASALGSGVRPSQCLVRRRGAASVLGDAHHNSRRPAPALYPNAELRALLEETRQYLLQLPPVPVTLEFAARLDVAVNQADSTRAKRLAVGVLETAVRDVTTLSAGEYMRNGVPLYSVHLEGRRLTFRSPGIKDGCAEAGAELVRRIGEGMVIQMEPPRRR